jgi:DNA-binding response OmpR family regulator
MVNRSIVVVVDVDAWVHRAIAAVISSDGFDVVPCTTARGALNACCALEPDCVVTELALPDVDGLWLASALRDQGGNVGAIPIVLASGRPDEETRIAALRGGADVFVPKPLRILELVAQIKALVSMARRLRPERSSVLPGDAPRALRGDLARMSVATVLGALELERRSGELVLRRPGERVVLDLASGLITGGRGSSRPNERTPLTPLEALRRALRWDAGRFDFAPGPDRAAPAHAEPFGSLVLAAIRLDEDPARASLPSLSGLDLSAPASSHTSGTRPAAPAVSAFRASAAPPLPSAPRASATSGTRPKVAPPPLPAAARATGLGSKLVESMVPSARPDPRAEPDDDAATRKVAKR